MVLEQRGYTVNEKTEEIRESKVNAIGFFSGAGGLDIGAQLAGVKVIASLDFDKDSVDTMRANSYFKHATHFHKDIQTVKAADYSTILKHNNPEKLILIGGPPCQPFSKGGYWVTHDKRKGNDDPRNMIGNYLRIIAEIQPDGFLLENVESILHPTNKIAIENLAIAINNLGYKFQIIKSNALDYGVPQKRKRVFILANKGGFKGDPLKTHGKFEDIKSNPILLPHESVSNWIERYQDSIYFEPEELTIGKTYSRELMAVPAGKNYLALTDRDGYPDAPFKAGTRFWNFLLKLDPLLPSWTISAQPGPWVGPFHWSGRRLRVPEIAAIQTFPEDYIFKGNRRSIQKQIGNAVPSLLGQAMVKHLIYSL